MSVKLLSNESFASTLISLSVNRLAVAVGRVLGVSKTPKNAVCADFMLIRKHRWNLHLDTSRAFEKLFSGLMHSGLYLFIPFWGLKSKESENKICQAKNCIVKANNVQTVNQLKRDPSTRSSSSSTKKIFRSKKDLNQIMETKIEFTKKSWKTNPV